MSDRDVARLHPVVITVASLVTVGLLGVFTVASEDPAPYRAVVALFSFLAFLALGVWLRAIYRVGIAASGRKVFISGDWFFFIPAFALAINKLTSVNASSMFEQSIAAISVFVGGISYIFCAWKAAEEFEHGDRVGRVATTFSVFGTFIALFYVFIGAWILRPRIMRLTESG